MWLCSYLRKALQLEKVFYLFSFVKNCILNVLCLPLVSLLFLKSWRLALKEFLPYMKVSELMCLMKQFGIHSIVHWTQEVLLPSDRAWTNVTGTLCEMLASVSKPPFVFMTQFCIKRHKQTTVP